MTITTPYLRFIQRDYKSREKQNSTEKMCNVSNISLYARRGGQFFGIHT